MTRMNNILAKIRRRLLGFRYKPIRVFCLHHVGEEYNSLLCAKEDFISESLFRQIVSRIEKNCHFISLEDAYSKIKTDSFRLRNYAVLTFDDGYYSPVSVFHWLDERNIPYTLFLNARYIVDKCVSPHIMSRAKALNSDVKDEEVGEGLYLTKEFLRMFNHGNASFGSHGFEHLDATTMTVESFQGQVRRNMAFLRTFPQSIPFHAYTWGRHSEETDNALLEMGLIPVLMDGGKNYNDCRFVHRELFPSC